jgi:hypothetical protein
LWAEAAGFDARNKTSTSVSGEMSDTAVLNNPPILGDFRDALHTKIVVAPQHPGALRMDRRIEASRDRATSSPGTGLTGLMVYVARDKRLGMVGATLKDFNFAVIDNIARLLPFTSP